MSFLWPTMLFSLILIPLFVGLYLFQQQRRRRIVAQAGSLGFVQGGPGTRLGSRRHIPAVLFLIGLAVLLFSLARPTATVQVPRIEGTVLLAFDVSGSMSAEDFEPNRMEAAKAAARTFVERQPSGVLIGVIAFSDNGFAIQAPTSDKDAILTAISRLTPQRGTALGHGIIAALNVLRTEAGQEPISLDPNAERPAPIPATASQSAAIVLISDGENNERPDPFDAAQLAMEQGVAIHTVGIGSPNGAVIEVEGFMVNTMLNEPLLRELSEITGGEYYSAQNEKDLEEIYSNVIPQLVIKPEKTEITSIFAGAGTLIFLIGGAFSLAWFRRLP